LSGWWAAAFVVQWILLAVLAVVVIALARDRRPPPTAGAHGRARGGRRRPTDRARAAGAHGQGADGTPTLIGGPGPLRLVAFTSPTCPICEQVVPSIPAAAAAARLVPQVVSDPDLETAYAVPGVPFLVVLDGSGIVRSKGTVNSLEQIEGLIDTALRRIDEASEVRAS
jgi:hypothetical protein